MASLPSRTRIIDDLITTTWYDQKAEVVDQVLVQTPFYDKMVEAGRIREDIGSGTHFELTLRYDKLNQNTKWLGRGGTVGRQEKQHLTTALYEKRVLATAIPRFFHDEIKNKGKSKIVDYAAEKVEATKAAYADTLAASTLIQDSDAEAILALETLIATDPTTGTVGGIDRASNDWWRNQTMSFSGLSILADLIDKMTTMYNNCSNYKGGGRRNPDVILCDQTVYEGFERICRSLQQIVTSKSDRVSLGFGDLMFKGAEIFYDPALAGTGRMYFLNTDFLMFKYDPEVWFDMTEWKSDVDGVDRVAQILSVCQLCASNFRKQGVIHSIA